MSGAAAGARIGPNAIIQVAQALDRAIGARDTEALFEASGLGDYLRCPPQQMVAEAQVIALHSRVRESLPAAAARAVAITAGCATAQYLLENRIPRLAQRLLRIAPRRLGGRLLLEAIARHAWTFTGSGVLSVSGGPRPVLTVTNCPICRGAHGAEPLCDYYRATFETLFATLIDPTARVHESQCIGLGARACRFEVRFGP